MRFTESDVSASETTGRPLASLISGKICEVVDRETGRVCFRTQALTPRRSIEYELRPELKFIPRPLERAATKDGSEWSTAFVAERRTQTVAYGFSLERKME